MRIAFFGDGAWAAESLLRLQKAGHEIVSVVLRLRQTDQTLERTANEQGLKTYRPRRVNNSGFVQLVKGWSTDLNLSVSYDQVLKKPMLDLAKRGFVNFHAGKLPDYRGRNVINWAIINGEEEIGLTAHYVDEGIDTGDIILQHTIPVGWTETYGEVLDRVVTGFPDLVCETVDMIDADRVIPVSQSFEMGTYYCRRVEGDEWLDWSESSRNLHNKVRAITHPGPGARATAGGHEIVIWRAFYDPAWPNYRAVPGEVVGKSPRGGVVVKTGDSVISVQEAEEDARGCFSPNWPIGFRFDLGVPSVG
ncbi:MAG: methionyl-tRNA formyltransferase [Candidatus Latescibacterota bacterium]|nr:methionyl-tRNA formyltransferase [Candidatus Latescibacterota bacterium]